MHYQQHRYFCKGLSLNHCCREGRNVNYRFNLSQGGISAEDTYNCISVAVEKQNRKMVTLLLKNYQGVIHNDILLSASKMGSISIIKLLLSKVERIDSSLFRNLINGEHVDLIIYTLKMKLLEEDSLNLTPQQVQEYQTVLIFFQTWERY